MFFLESIPAGLLLAGLAAVVYLGTVPSDYVFDDLLVIESHPDVQRGIAGIPRLLTSDAFAHVYGQDAEQARFRPLSFVTFAIEVSIFGSSPPGSKVVNILIYAASVWFLWLLLRCWMPGRPGMVWVVGLLFAVHPIHAEAVANIKGRDELLSLFFILLLGLLLWRPGFNAGWRVPGIVLCLFMALLAKEYALLMVAFVPFSWRILPVSRTQASWSMGGLLLGFAAYLALRISSVGLGAGDLHTDLLHDPYKGVDWLMALPTKLELLFLHVRFTIWPHPLRYEYQFAQFPLRTWASPLLWLSIASYTSIGLGGIWLWWKRAKPGLACAWVLLALFPVSNLLIEIGTPFNERLGYHASLGFIWLLVWIVSQVNLPWRVATGLVTVSGLALAACTASRSLDWRSQDSLFIGDLPAAAGSPIAQGNAAAMYMDREDWTNALRCVDTALALAPEFADSYLNRAIIYGELGDPERAVVDMNQFRTLRPEHPEGPNLQRYLAFVYRDVGWYAAQDRLFDDAITAYRKAVELGPNELAIVYELGGALFEAGRPVEAFPLWIRCRQADSKRFGPWQGFDGEPAPLDL